MIGMVDFFMMFVTFKFHLWKNVEVETASSVTFSAVSAECLILHRRC